MGFIVVDIDKWVLIAYCCQIWIGSSLEAKVLAFKNALTLTNAWKLNVGSAYTNCAWVMFALQQLK